MLHAKSKLLHQYRGLLQLEEHKNKECICYDSADSFTIEDVDIILFNKEEK